MISILRLGHRPHRDFRVTTHVALVARCFGADRMYIAVEDRELQERIDSVNRRFGGHFSVYLERDWKKLIRDFQGTVVHLTMYGLKLSETLPSMRREDDLLVIVGAEKVPSEVYTLSDYNISVGNQPHSEIAALAIFLDRWTGGAWEKAEFGGRIRIIPDARGKRVAEY